MSTKGMRVERDKFAVEVKYSEEAIEKKLIKFIVKEGNEIVLSADELVGMLVNQVNSDVLSATFVETNRINVVEVVRQIKCVLDRDFKKDEVIQINYTHPYPIEFALIEEVWKIAQLKKDAKVTELTLEYIEEVKKKIRPDMVEYMKKFYDSFKSININKKMEDETKDLEAAEEVVEEVAEEVEAVEAEEIAAGIEVEEEVEKEEEAI